MYHVISSTYPSNTIPLASEFLKVFFKTGENEIAKVGIALSSKNFKRAVDRNRARRLTSQAFQEIYPSLPNNINIVALPKAGVLSVKSDDLVLDLETIHAKLIN